MKILVRSDGPSPIEIIASRGRNVNLLNKAKEAFSFINDDTERDALVNSALYLKVHLGSVLQRNDRMGMMHSIESRIPFLENNVVKFALNLPIKYKHPNTISGLIFGHPLEKNKRIVREIAEGLIPDSIIKRKKMGFPVSPDEYVSYKSDFFIDGFLERSLGFKHEEFKMFFNSIDIELKWNFFATEIFGKLFFLNIPHDVVTEKIKTYTNNICSI